MIRSSRGWRLIIALELVAVCACCCVLGALVTTGGWRSAQNFQAAPAVPSLTTPGRAATRVPTWTPAATDTPAPTFTRVIPPPPPNLTVPPFTAATRAPTRSVSPYDIVVPTPTAPRMIYPISFESRLGVETYNVTGQTLGELSRSLDAQAMADPNDPSGRYYAQTQWYLASRWSYQPTARGCEVTSGSVTLTMTMTLPILAPAVGTAPDVLKHWTVFIDNTIEHETGHVKLNLQDARNFQRDLGNLPPAPDCATISWQLTDLFDRATNVIRRDNIDYDTKTRHGATQGAVFP
jgi:predicted secreted Zn-dependent protease